PLYARQSVLAATLAPRDPSPAGPAPLRSPGADRPTEFRGLSAPTWPAVPTARPPRDVRRFAFIAARTDPASALRGEQNGRRSHAAGGGGGGAGNGSGGGRLGGRRLGGGQAEDLAHLVVELLGEVGMLGQVLLGVFAALADALALVRIPRARLFDQILLGGQIHQVAGVGDALAVHDVELGFAEGRRDLVLHDFGAGAVADDGVAVLDGGDAADIDADRGVELERAPAGGGFRAAEHDADFFADLVDEHQHGARLRYQAGELAQRLRHQPRLQADVRIAHLAVELGLGHQGRHRVHHQHVHRARAHQRLGDLERLFAVVGLRD